MLNWCFPDGNDAEDYKRRAVPTKVEPKTYFANERTFLAWLHMSVTLASISVAILAFAEHNEAAQLIGTMMLPVALFFAGYALYTFQWRAKMIRERAPGPYYDKFGPVVLCSLLIAALVINFSMKLIELAS
mmetsp:Transcript_938/g.1671  ORF Transcript_938/g.1671 Transcript_938/m.1671 type:complete len:131 (+) Transcript_938:37-429(+)